MRYVYELTVPADTKAADPYQDEVDLVKGRLNKIEVGFPPGCASMVRVQVRDGLFQVTPANPGGYHAWDNYNEIFGMDYELTDPKPRLILVGWSAGTVFAHTITFRFDVTPADQDERSILTQQVLGGFKPLG